MKKRISLILALVMLCALLAACGSGDQPAGAPDANSPATSQNTDAPVSGDSQGSAGKTTITVLRPGDQDKVASFMEPAVEAFEKENPDIHVEIMYESWAGWIQTYPTYFEAGTQPDVIFWWDNKLHDSSANSHLVDLSGYLSEDLVNKIPQGVWNLASPGDMEGLYYVPSSVDTFVLYYNKDLFTAAGLDPDAPPATWDELLAAAKAIKEKTGKAGIGVPAINGAEVLQEFVGCFINQATDAPILDSSSMPLFNTPEGQQALDFLEQLWPYVQDSPTEYGRGELRPLIRDGEVGMLIEGPWAISTMTAAYGDDFTKDGPVGIAELPAGPNGKKITWAGTNGWIATRTETAEASAKFIEYLMSDDVLKAHHLAYGSAPLYDSELNDPAFQYDHWSTFYKEAQEYTLYGMIGKNSATPAAYYTALEEVWQQFLLGQMNAEDAMSAAIAAVENVTARNS